MFKNLLFLFAHSKSYHYLCSIVINSKIKDYENRFKKKLHILLMELPPFTECAEMPDTFLVLP